MSKTSSYEVDGDVLTWITKAGDEIVIDLDIPADVLAGAMGVDGKDDPDDETQVQRVLDWIGEDAVAAFDKMGILERTRFTGVFFAEFTKAVQLARGESVSSLLSAGSTETSSASISDDTLDSRSTETSA